jgi:DNA-binding transcriptional LysR family regulator
MKSAFDWNDLTFFLELSRQGRLAPTARRLRVDNATVSRRIAELERALERKLFERSADGFTLSEAGMQLLHYAEAMETNAREIDEALSSTRKTSLTGAVRLATMEGIASFYLSRKLAVLRRRQPGLLVELVTSAQLLNLTKREADISLSFTKPQGPRLAIELIGTFQLKLYAGADYLERHETPTAAADLAAHEFVDYIDDLVAIDAVRWLADVIRDPIVTFRSNSMIAQQNAAAAGLGLALLPSFSARDDRRLTPVLADSVAVSRDLWLSVHEDFRHIGRVRAVMDFVRESVQDDRDYLNGR